MNAKTTNDFRGCFIRELLSSLTRNYSGNYDYHRFGKHHLKQKLKELIRGMLHKHGFYRINSDVLTRYMNSGEIENFEYLYAALNDEESKQLLIKIILYRLLGNSKVKLPLNDAGILQRADESHFYSFPSDALPLKFLKWKLIKYDLSKLNYPIQVYSSPMGIVTQFIFKQYVYQTAEVVVKPEYGDTILDCGGCFGEAALFFAHETGPDGKVYTFEFIKKNIEICRKNMSLNPELAKRILLIEQPVWENSGSRLFYVDDGPASRVAFERFDGAEEETTSVCIDETVMNSALGKVDFIKMDIEGAEFPALKGAATTLKKYKPKLAISIYHNPEDFKRIPEFIKAVSPGYALYLGHYSVHEEETVLFAIHE